MPSASKSYLLSCCCFSEVKSIKTDEKYELVQSALQVFPGPHAFLLATNSRKATWKKDLKTITEAFGKEACEYAVVLNIGRTEPAGIGRVRECEISVLQDNDESVQDLFRKIDNMTQNKEFPFFMHSSYKNAFLSWEKKKCAEMIRETDKLLKQKEKQHENEVRIIESTNRKEMDDKEKQYEQRIAEINEEIALSKKQFDNLKSFIKDIIRLIKDNRQEVQAGDSSDFEDMLIQKLEAADSKTNLGDIFSSIVNEVSKSFKTCKETSSYMMDVLLKQEKDNTKKIEELKEVVQKLLTDLERGQRAPEKQDMQEEHNEREQRVTSGSEHERRSSMEFPPSTFYEDEKAGPLDAVFPL